MSNPTAKELNELIANGWRFDETSTYMITLIPPNDERRGWAAVWMPISFYIPNWWQREFG
jgi:hypothetical protein